MTDADAGREPPPELADEPDPIALFARWLAEAEASEPNDANAMTVATVDAEGRPAARILLLKGIDDGGFVFYTNLESRKGRELLGHPQAALCFHWKSLRRQVRVEGACAPVSEAAADAYFASRPRGSRIGAWASDQSRPLDGRATLVDRVAELERRFGDGPVPRPPHWSGFRLVPDRIEFWRDREFRLHDRIVFQRDGDAWRVGRLYP